MSNLDLAIIALIITTLVIGTVRSVNAARLQEHRDTAPAPEDDGNLRIVIRGGRHRGPDGTNRQAAYQRLDIGEKLELVSEPDNPVDPDAVAVIYRGKKTAHLGYLPAAFAYRFNREHLKGGRPYACTVWKVIPDKFNPALLAVIIALNLWVE